MGPDNRSGRFAEEKTLHTHTHTHTPGNGNIISHFLTYPVRSLATGLDDVCCCLPYPIRSLFFYFYFFPNIYPTTRVRLSTSTAKQCTVPSQPLLQALPRISNLLTYLLHGA